MVSVNATHNGQERRKRRAKSKDCGCGDRRHGAGRTGTSGIHDRPDGRHRINAGCTGR
jgi:hypothetical protein